MTTKACTVINTHTLSADMPLWDLFLRRTQVAMMHPHALDPEMLGILQLFNKVPGVCTRFSCQGHPEQNTDGQASGYIMLVTTPDGDDWMRGFWREYLVSQFELDKNYDSYYMEYDMSIHTVSNTWYPCWTLRTRKYSDPARLSDIHQRLQVALATYLQNNPL